MVPGNSSEALTQQCFPRASGDGPLENVRAILDGKFPPRERGWSRISR